MTTAIDTCVDPTDTSTHRTGVEAAEVNAVMDGSRVLLGVVARTLGDALGDVTLAQFRALTLIRRTGAMRVGDLADELAIRPSSSSRMVDRLQGAGYLTRHPAAGDRREVSVQLTPAGERLVHEAMAHRRAALTAILSHLTSAERSALRAGLAAMARVAHEYTDDAVLLGM